MSLTHEAAYECVSIICQVLLSSFVQNFISFSENILCQGWLSHLAIFNLFLSFPQVLFVVVQAVVDGFGQVCSDLGSGLVVACPVAARVLTEARRGLCDDKDLVDILVI